MGIVNSVHFHDFCTQIEKQQINRDMSQKTKERILLAARDEFMSKGFQDASLRTIAKEAGVTVSNIYRHFEHKDSLFVSVLTPLLEQLEDILSAHNSEKQMELYANAQEEYREVNTKLFLEIIEHFRPELKLLLTQSAGSSLGNYPEELLDRQVAIGRDYLKIYQEKYPTKTVYQVSTLFMRINSSWWITMLREMASNDRLTLREMKQCISEYMTFGMAGWNAFLNTNRQSN